MPSFGIMVPLQRRTKQRGKGAGLRPVGLPKDCNWLDFGPRFRWVVRNHLAHVIYHLTIHVLTSPHAKQHSIDFHLGISQDVAKTVFCLAFGTSMLCHAGTLKYPLQPLSQDQQRASRYVRHAFVVHVATFLQALSLNKLSA